MTLADYIDTLRKTRTYQAGLISFQEYSFETRMLGLGRVLPHIPHADEDRHIVVMEIRGNIPNILTVLKDPNHSIQTTTKDVDKLLFVFIEMRPHTLVVESPANGYRLGDGHRIDAKFTVTYQIRDAKVFWSGNRDQLSEFETVITDAAKNFFLDRSSNSLIGSPADFKQALEGHILKTEISVIKNELETSIRTCSVAGIELNRVMADVYIGDSLHDHLRRIHERLYGEGGLAERLKIDQIIDSDVTFAPYKLRTVIGALDMRLLENFYAMKWSDAMRKVTEKVAEKKQEYMTSVEQKELDRMVELKDRAERLGLEDEDVLDLKSKLAKRLLSMAESDSSTHGLSDSEYLKAIIPLSPELMLESDSKKPKSIGEGTDT
ncbi:MAG TPA: hypothetical protein DCZ04_17040 [Syntrophorhabdus aromaticivorans]|nr:hypothetical protein [Syntrophorhabdus aromaticivorans]